MNHAKKDSLGIPVIEEEATDNASNPSFFNSSRRSVTYKPNPADQNLFTFNKEIESGFKSAIYLKMETMIDNIKKYRDDFKGNRIPKFEEKFVKERIHIANKARARELRGCSNVVEHDRRVHVHKVHMYQSEKPA